MQNFAPRLISAERRSGDSTDTEGRAAFRVCAKLGDSLSALAGRRGFRALLMRALTLAQAKNAWLGKVAVGADGTLVSPAELEAEIDSKEIAKGGAALVGHLLELLETLIGEALTRRFVQQTWPKAALGDSKADGKS